MKIKIVKSHRERERDQMGKMVDIYIYIMMIDRFECDIYQPSRTIINVDMMQPTCLYMHLCIDTCR